MIRLLAPHLAPANCVTHPVTYRVSQGRTSDTDHVKERSQPQPARRPVLLSRVLLTGMEGLPDTLAAMEYELMLPAQFRQRQPSVKRSGPIRPHLDLGLALKGTGKTWNHLSEVLLRLGLPSGLMEGKKRVAFPSNDDGWLAARAHCELDTALLAVATMAWQRTQGQCNLDPKVASFVILDWLRRNRPLTEAMQTNLAGICEDLSHKITDRMALAA